METGVEPRSLTAKEKAEELVNKYKPLVYPFSAGSGFLSGDISEEMIIRNAKKCAQIAVDEILQTNPTLKGTSEDLITMIVQTKAYWHSVSINIEKIK